MKYLVIAALLLQGCVLSSASFVAKTDNGFYLSVKDGKGFEISTGASVNDPEYVPELKEMYVALVKELKLILGE